MKYYIIAGEASGDLHASNLMKEIKKVDNAAVFRGWGGDKMLQQNLQLVKHYKDTAFMGFAEVLFHLRTIFNNINFCKNDILQFHPDAIILVDYPGFNLRIAEFAKENNFKTFYYISPQLWAWKQSRLKSIKKNIDKMFVILPFEKKFYEDRNYSVEFVGHPLLDVIHNKSHDDYKLDLISQKDSKPLIALLPGSRKQEIQHMLPIMLSLVSKFRHYKFIVGGVTSVGNEFYQKIMLNHDVEIIFDQTYNLLRSADAALVTSGTASLETALLGVPEVVCYKGSTISYMIAKKLVGKNISFISLVNLIMNKEIVKELIQNELTSENLSKELNLILNDSKKREELKNGYNELTKTLGGQGASKKTAELIYNDLSNSHEI